MSLFVQITEWELSVPEVARQVFRLVVTLFMVVLRCVPLGLAKTRETQALESPNSRKTENVTIQKSSFRSIGMNTTAHQEPAKKR
jgi:hypothetical protein